MNQRSAKANYVPTKDVFLCRTHIIKNVKMDIPELYKIFTEHPVVTTDSRDCPEDSIFFALKGASFNGNAFAAKALDEGCAYAVIDEKQYAAEGDSRYILVDNCLKTLQQLANHHRRKLGTRIVGITGTNGKTTTKELLAAVLGERYNVLYTQGNFNNDIGVPKTLLRLTKEHDIAVIEMGASHPGDIKTLVDIVEPDCGLITNVGRAHLQGFGSFEGVIRTKGELYDYLRAHGGTAFVNAGDEHLMGIAHGLDIVKYGLGGTEGAKVEGEVTVCDPYLNFRWRTEGGPWRNVRTHIIGSYNLMNMLAAACVGLHFGVTPEQISHALASYVPRNNRSELEQTAHNSLIIDAYNANPTSMAAALANFRDMKADRKMAILGDMNELGAVSGEEHQRVADFLQSAGFDLVWLVGPEFGKTECTFRKFKDVDEVKKELEASRPEGFCILIKGSNSIRLYQLKEWL